MKMEFRSDVTVRLVQQVGGDHMIVAAARVSTSGEEALKCLDLPAAESAGLISYLMKHRHGTPFEHSSLTFFVHAPIFVWREWHRHRIGFCVAGASCISFLNTYNESAGKTKTIREVWNLWENGHKCGHISGGINKALKSVRSGSSVRSASANFGVSAETIRRHLRGEVLHGRQSCRHRIRGMKIRVLNETTKLCESGHITNVTESGIQEIVSVKVETGHCVRLTKGHRLLTRDGWIEARNLSVGDKVAVPGYVNTDPNAVPPSLRRGIGVWTSMQRSRLISKKDRCYICGSIFGFNDLILDHIVPVISDLASALDRKNLRPTCRLCHKVKSANEQPLRTTKLRLGACYRRIVEPVKVIGETDTYDLSIDHHHNFVADGIIVHNSYNEESGRYSQLKPVFYLPPRDRPMFKVEDWKPGRPKFLPIANQVGELAYDKLCCNLKEIYESAYTKYEENLGLYIDPGLARACLPVGIYSSCWVTCNPRSLMAFLSLRTHEPDSKFVSYPLYEIELAARAVERIFAEGWPLTHAAFVENGRVGP